MEKSEIILDINNLKYMIEYIYYNITIDSIIYDNKKYYERSNIYTTAPLKCGCSHEQLGINICKCKNKCTDCDDYKLEPVKSRLSFDKFVESLEYMDKKSLRISSTLSLNDFKYHFGTSIHFYDDMIIPKGPIYYDFYHKHRGFPLFFDKPDKKLLNILEDGSFMNILFKLPFSIIINGINKVNEDHRGANHYQICIDYWKSYSIDEGYITGKDLANALFRIKSHKNDNNYELCSIDDDDCFEKISDNLWNINIGVDHGS